MSFVRISVFVISGILLLGLTLHLVAPSSLDVERSITVSAPKFVVMKYIKSFPKMREWSVWDELDTNAIHTYEGEEGNVGSKHIWKGNSDMGSGSQEITFLSDSQVDTKLIFTEPWQAVNYTSMKLKSDSSGVIITWSMTGETPFPANIFFMLMGIDKAIADDLGRGLERLKIMVEEATVANVFRGYWINRIEQPEKKYVFKRSLKDFSEIQTFYVETFPIVHSAIEKAGNVSVGNPTGLFFSWDETNRKSNLGASMPFTGSNSFPKGYEILTLGGKALQIEYAGPYSKSGDAHFAIDDYLSKYNLTSKGIVLEEYVTSIASEHDLANARINIIYLID